MTRKGCFLLALALAGPGCMSPLTHLENEPHKSPPVQAAVAPPPPPPIVTPDEVTEANAGEMAAALSRELDHAGNERPTASLTPPAGGEARP
jgi:hypothetical protein